MNLLKSSLWMAGIVFSMSTTAHASLIFDNGSPNQIFGDNMSEVVEAEDFVFASDFNVSTIRYWSIQSVAGDYRGSTYWAIYSNNAGAPGTIIQGGVTSAVAGTATGLSTSFNYPEYIYEIPVGFQLTAGTYWLALHNGLISDGSTAEMLWSTTATGSGTAGKYTSVPVAESPVWISTDQEHAFQLDGTAVGVVPEPGSIALMISGLAVGALLRRKRS